MLRLKYVEINLLIRDRSIFIADIRSKLKLEV